MKPRCTTKQTRFGELHPSSEPLPARTLRRLKSTRSPWLPAVMLTLIAILLILPTMVYAADLDLDGMDDALEDSLAVKFAPEVRLHPDDVYRPSNVNWYLARVIMRFDHGSSCLDDQILNQGQVNVNSLISQQWEDHNGFPLCNNNGTFELSGSSIAGPKDHTSFFLQIPNDGQQTITRQGDLGTAKCYVNVKPTIGHHPGMIDIIYIFFYPYNGTLGIGVGAHEGDFEQITVRVAKDLESIHRIYYAAHDAEGKWYEAANPAGSNTGYNLNSSGRPFVYSSKHSHASYPWAQQWTRGSGKPDDNAADGGPSWDTRSDIANVGHLSASGASVPRVGMEWIKYTGRWGEIGFDDSQISANGPQSPPFQTLEKDYGTSWWLGNFIANDDSWDHGWRFVDAAWPFPSISLGTWLLPFKYFPPAESNVPAIGTIWIKPGNYSSVGTYSKTVRIEAPYGGVTLGD